MTSVDTEAANALVFAATRAASGHGESRERASRVGQKRWRIPPNGQELLECVYAQAACPSSETRDALALQLGATPRQIQVWFQNKRQRALKREQKAAAAGNPTPVVDVTPSQASMQSISYATSTQQQLQSKPQQRQQQQPAAQAYSSAALNTLRPPPPQPSMRVVSASYLVAQPPPQRPSQPLISSGGTSPPPQPPQPQSTPPDANRSMPMRRNGTIDSLADLAEVAECVDSIEHLAGGLHRVGSLKDLANGLAGLNGDGISRAGSLKDLASLSRAGSLADLASRGSQLDLASLSRVGSLMDMQMASRAMEMHMGSSLVASTAPSAEEQRRGAVASVASA